jgi:undecaprenyl-phosphate galactose phosphotransferase/putative colanic acid biosynthesis UDP-glucose lipid carrier transferase
MSILLTKRDDSSLDDRPIASPPPEEKKRAFWRSLLHPAAVERFLVAADVFLIMVSGLACAVGYHWYTTSTYGKVGTYAAASVLVALNFVILRIAQHGYRLHALTILLDQVKSTIAIWTCVFAGLITIAFSMKISEEFSRGATLCFYFLGLAVLLVWKTAVSRWVAHALQNNGFRNSRSIVIAEQGLVSSSLPLIKLRQHGYQINRILEISATDLSSPLLMSTVNSRLSGLIDYAREEKIEHVFLLFNWGRQHVIDSILNALKILPIPVHLIPDTNVARFLKYPIMNEGGLWSSELRRAPLTLSERAMKRALDVAGAFTALLTFAPLMIMVAILIKFDSPGTVLFRQTRNGFNGRAFKIFKFRTMKVAEDGAKITQATKNDSRVTRLGRLLRKTSIDELPQLLNVLRGDMSLVGPRPHAAAHNVEYEQIIGSYAFRHHVKPGITGWAQVSGYRGETKAIALMEKRIECDLWYINNWSIWLDLSIIARTAVGSFWQARAY